jgi:FkbM family methyltransferase
MPQFKVRPNTYDASIFDYVCRQNEYELADLSGKRILDIGGHIGSFAVKAVAHGAEQVVSFEPDDGNYELLEFNIGHFENASCEHLAISRSDKDVAVRFDKSDDAVNSGGGCSVTDFGEVVPSMSLDAAIDKYQPNFIKIDAEGVGTSGMGVFMFEENTPEFLADFKGRLTMVSMAEFLKEQGFRVLYEYTAGEQLGLFWASKSFDCLLVEPK